MESANLEAAESLQALRVPPCGRRSGAYLAKLLPKIETALDDGYSRADVHTAFKSAGLDLAFRAFTKALYRARRKARAVPQLPPSLPAQAQPTPTTSPPRPTTPPPPAWTVTPAPASTVKPAEVAHSDQSASPPPPPARTGWVPGSIGEIARSQPDMVGLGKRGREYAARLKAEDKAKKLAESGKTG